MLDKISRNMLHKDNYDKHPYNIYPTIAGEAAEALEESLKNGYDETMPIIIYEGKILDGWNRYITCKKLGITPTYKVFEGTAYEAIQLVARSNARRDLTPGQRAAIALELAPMFEAAALERKFANLKQNSPMWSRDHIGSEEELPMDSAESVGEDEEELPMWPAGHNGEKGRTREYVAKLVGVGESTIHRVKYVKQQDPELFDDIKQGKIAANIAYKKVKLNEYHKTEQIKKDVTDVVINKDMVKLYNCDILDAPIEDNSIDVIITDPPYPKEYLECWNKLAQFARDKLTDGGILITLSGQSYLPEVYARMNIDGLQYYWTCCVKLTVSPDLRKKRLKTQWKPMLWYVKGDYNKTYLNTDVFDNYAYNDTVNSQQYHKWGQPLRLMEDIVDKFTYKDDVICDPFAGGGTTIIAAINKKRKIIGIEIDNTNYNKLTQRVQEHVK